MVRAMSHVVFDVSGHGFGHLAQVAEVLHELHAMKPDVRVTVRADHPAAILRVFLPDGVTIDRPPRDATLAMRSPVDVDVPASLARYAALHDDWAATVAAEATRLAALDPDLLVSDVGYVGLAAARQLGIPAHPLCSLDWYAVFRAYGAASSDFERIGSEILAAYRGAGTFLQLTPHLPMTYLEDRVSFGPVARLGRDRRAEMERRFPMLAGRRLVVFSLGGIPGGSMPGDLPRSSGICWICDGNSTEGAGGDGLVSLASLGLPFIDVLASVDAIVTKPGYGMIVEAVCNGTAVISTERPDWPETPHLQDWASRCGRAVFVPRGPRWIDDALAAALALPEGPGPTPAGPAGGPAVAAYLAGRLDG
jgi:hypothetical protein